MAHTREAPRQDLATLVVRRLLIARPRFAHGDTEDERQPVESIAHSSAGGVGSGLIECAGGSRRRAGQGQCESDSECRAHVPSIEQMPCPMHARAR